MSEFGDYLKELRGNRSLREMERITGLSHTYLSSLEKGIDPRSGKERKPTPEALLKISNSLNVTYSYLMSLAGYIGREDIQTEEQFVEIENRLERFRAAKRQFERNLEQKENSEKLFNELSKNENIFDAAEIESRKQDLLKQIYFCDEENKELFEYMTEDKNTITNELNEIYYSLKSKIK